ncbi:hypothetical protein [Almyronema epifaneia]|uniref:Uncharacterized protein n=1 Tax=Almyronema epifaneia S1 TaxID=2991925 RepID=A0ABW6IA78_9CYAN
MTPLRIVLACTTSRYLGTIANSSQLASDGILIIIALGAAFGLFSLLTGLITLLKNPKTPPIGSGWSSSDASFWGDFSSPEIGDSGSCPDSGSSGGDC